MKVQVNWQGLIDGNRDKGDSEKLYIIADELLKLLKATEKKLEDAREEIDNAIRANKASLDSLLESKTIIYKDEQDRMKYTSNIESLQKVREKAFGSFWRKI